MKKLLSFLALLLFIAGAVTLNPKPAQAGVADICRNPPSHCVVLCNKWKKMGSGEDAILSKCGSGNSSSGGNNSGGNGKTTLSRSQQATRLCQQRRRSRRCKRACQRGAIGPILRYCRRRRRRSRGPSCSTVRKKCAEFAKACKGKRTQQCREQSAFCNQQADRCKNTPTFDVPLPPKNLSLGWLVVLLLIGLLGAFAWIFKQHRDIKKLQADLDQLGQDAMDQDCKLRNQLQDVVNLFVLKRWITDEDILELSNKADQREKDRELARARQRMGIQDS